MESVEKWMGSREIILWPVIEINWLTFLGTTNKTISTDDENEKVLVIALLVN